jgi:hypothetical protein
MPQEHCWLVIAFFPLFHLDSAVCGRERSNSAGSPLSATSSRKPGFFFPCASLPHSHFFSKILLKEELREYCANIEVFRVCVDATGSASPSRIHIPGPTRENPSIQYVAQRGGKLSGHILSFRQTCSRKKRGGVPAVSAYKLAVKTELTDLVHLARSQLRLPAAFKDTVD